VYISFLYTDISSKSIIRKSRGNKEGEKEGKIAHGKSGMVVDGKTGRKDGKNIKSSGNKEKNRKKYNFSL
jgi:hypothetical protein